MYKFCHSFMTYNKHKNKILDYKMLSPIISTYVTYDTKSNPSVITKYERLHNHTK